MGILLKNTVIETFAVLLPGKNKAGILAKCCPLFSIHGISPGRFFSLRIFFLNEFFQSKPLFNISDTLSEDRT